MLQATTTAEYLIQAVDPPDRRIEDQPGWLRRFHAGDRNVIDQCYRTYFKLVEATAARFVSDPDIETVIHEVFYSLLSERKVRLGFSGGAFGAWLRTVTRNRAIDHLRRRSKERLTDAQLIQHVQKPAQCNVEDQAELSRIVNEFRTDWIPEAWVGVFDARFVRQLSQRDAAEYLGLSRTTLVYREQRIRRQLRRYLRRRRAGG